MGKRRRLNRFITKWIKSDLPDDCSTVLLLGVTRIPTTPTLPRRPTSLALNTNSQPNKPSLYPQPFDHTNRTPSLNNRLDDSCSSKDDDITPSNSNSVTITSIPTMDQSVDSIGACSLDADASVDIPSDWSDKSSLGTLRSTSLPTPDPQPHLPSYLSLACTVSGYSTTTNYDPERLSKSRDASPHRFNSEDVNFFTQQQNKNSVYSIRNNLLSPPNVVPLPHHKYFATPDTPRRTASDEISSGMEKQILTRNEFYSTKAVSIKSISNKENGSFDSVDGCIDKSRSKCVSYESKISTIENGSSSIVKFTSEASANRSYSSTNGTAENKSFIQQRVERLYGPGALAQGFFISKRQSNNFDVESNISTPKTNLSQVESLPDIDNGIKQSTSSPTLPVLRHLRPEFRAQLPIMSPKRENLLPKSYTENSLNGKLTTCTKINGHSNSIQDKQLEHINGNFNKIVTIEENDNSVKNGHYFLKILENETDRLIKLAERVESELANECLSEDIKGKLRSASGKARLLTSQKMQQFRGLCTKNITQEPGEAFPTTNEDLEGFWDMVMLQIDQVDALFKEIDAIRANNWEEIPCEAIIPAVNNKLKKSISKTVNKPLNNSTNIEARKKREAERKQLIEERRRAARERKKQESIQIYVPDSS